MCLIGLMDLCGVYECGGAEPAKSGLFGIDCALYMMDLYYVDNDSL